jgi:RNA polymerase sigma factor (sigma-70 family)
MMTTAGVIATSLVVSSSMTSAFQPSFASTRQYALGQRRTHAVCAVSGIDTEVQSQALRSNDSRDRRKAEEAFLRTMEDDDNTVQIPSRIQFRGLTTTSTRKKLKPSSELVLHRPLRTKSTNQQGEDSLAATQSLTVRSKQSTMPGFGAETSGQRAHKDGIRLLERRSGRKLKESQEQLKQRINDSGSKLYVNSVNAPDSLVHFSRQIQRHKLLSHDEEKTLGLAIQEAIRLQRLHDLLEAKLDRVPTDMEWCAAAGIISVDELHQTMEDGRQAKNKLVVSNLRLVQKVVNTYIRNGLSPQYNAADLMQEGIMALIRAAEKYEPSRGWKFSTYGMYWIRSAVKEAQVFQSRLIPLPQKLRTNCERLVRVEKKLRQALGRYPTRTEVSKTLGLSEYQVDRCYQALQVQCYSLDQPSTFVLKPDEPSKFTLADEVNDRIDSGDFAKCSRVLLQEDIIAAMNRQYCSFGSA